MDTILHETGSGSHRRHQHNAFVEYGEAGYLGEVLPVIPHDAKLTPNSSVDPSQRGKIPGEFSLRQGAWHGMTEWSSRTFIIDDCRKWDRWPFCNVGLRAKFFPAADFDMTHVPFRDACVAALRERIGDGPTRLRVGSTRLLIPSRLCLGGDPIGKLSIQAKLPGVEEPQLLEILGSGQYYNIAGIHPSGKPYQWESDLGPLSLTAANLPESGFVTWLDFFNHVESVIVPQFGGEIISSSRVRNSWANDHSRDIGDEALLAPDSSRAVEALNTIPDAQLDYDGWIRVMFAFKAAVGEEGFPSFYQWCKDFPRGCAEEYAKAKWDSIHSSSIGWEWLIREAGRYGFKPTGAEAGFDDIDPATIGDHGGDEEREQEQREEPKRSYRLFGEIKPDYSKPMLVKGWLQSTGHSVLYGFSGTGKSLVAFHIAACVATGRPWFGHKVQQGGVVYVALEGGDGIYKRIDALRHHHKVPDDAPIAVIKKPIAFSGRGAGKDVAELIAQIKQAETEMGQKVRLVIIDTVAQALGGDDENAAGVMSGYAAHVSRIEHEIGCHVLSVHHQGKDKAKGLRGSTALHAAVDTVMLVENNAITIPSSPTVGKQRDGARGVGIGFKVVSVLVGFDEDDDPVTGATIDEGPMPRQDGVKLGAEEERVLRFIDKANHLPAPGRLKLVPGATIVKRAQVREAYVADRELVYGDSGDNGDKNDVAERRTRKSANTAFGRACDRLRDAGKIEFDEEYLWFSVDRESATQP
jgi:hypothetical protein